MQRDHRLKEDRLGARDVLDGLTWHGIGQEPDEIAGMASPDGDANFRIGLEAAYARAVACARVDDHKGSALVIDLDALRRDDPRQCIVYRPFEGATVRHQFNLEMQDVGNLLLQMLAILVPSLAHDVEKKNCPLYRVGGVIRIGGDGVEEGAATVVWRSSRHLTLPSIREQSRLQATVVRATIPYCAERFRSEFLPAQPAYRSQPCLGVAAISRC